MAQKRPIDPLLEREDGYQFAIGELVWGFHIDGSRWYAHVIEDNRPMPHCNYLYTLAPVVAEPCNQNDGGGWVVYGCEPVNMNPTSLAEKVLYGLTEFYWDSKK
jgi:hypothetical protein